jgi:hypothetical protein
MNDRRSPNRVSSLTQRRGLGASLLDALHESRNRKWRLRPPHRYLQCIKPGDREGNDLLS